MSDIRPLGSFTPGDFIEEELEARGWTMDDLVEKLGWVRNQVDEMMAGARPITSGMALDLGLVFGTGSELFENMNRTYQEYLAKHAATSPSGQ